MELFTAQCLNILVCLRNLLTPCCSTSKLLDKDESSNLSAKTAGDDLILEPLCVKTRLNVSSLIAYKESGNIETLDRTSCQSHWYVSSCRRRYL